MAEALFRHAVSDRPEYSVKSAGVAASNGTKASRETVETLEEFDIELSDFASQAVSAKLLSEATHVFAMTEGHLRVLTGRFPEYQEKFFLACEFVDIPGIGVGADVPDPIGMGKKAYQGVADVLCLAIPSIVGYIDQTMR